MYREPQNPWLDEAADLASRIVAFGGILSGKFGGKDSSSSSMTNGVLVPTDD